MSSASGSVVPRFRGDHIKHYLGWSFRSIAKLVWRYLVKIFFYICFKSGIDCQNFKDFFFFLLPVSGNALKLERHFFLSFSLQYTVYGTNIYRRLSRWKQLGGLVPVLWLGVPPRCKASKLKYSYLQVFIYKSRYYSLHDRLSMNGYFLRYKRPRLPFNHLEVRLKGNNKLVFMQQVG